MSENEKWTNRPHKTRSAWAADRGACQVDELSAGASVKQIVCLHQSETMSAPRYSTPGKSVKRIQLKSPQGASSREWLLILY